MTKAATHCCLLLMTRGSTLDVGDITAFSPLLLMMRRDWDSRASKWISQAERMTGGV